MTTAVETPALTLEERVAALEEELATMKAQTPQSALCGWKKFVGVYKNDPEFEEAARFGREYREAQRPLEAKETAA